MVRRDSHIQVYNYATLSYESSKSLPDISIGGVIFQLIMLKLWIITEKNNGKD